MKPNYILFALFIFLVVNNALFAQEVVNGGFELSNQRGMARNWITENAGGSFLISLSKNEFHSGKQSLEINGASGSIEGRQNGIAANVYGSSSATKVDHVQLTGWIKIIEKLDSSVSLFIQQGSKIIRSGTVSRVKNGWHKVILDYTVPSGERWYRFYYGIEVGPGTRVWLDDIALIVNGLKIDDPRSLYQEPTQKKIDWLGRSVSVLKQLELGESFKDLSPLGDAIGDARVIGIGEPTHGTSEVAKFKTRILDYVIRQKGMRTIALEESIATCDQMNRLLNADTPALKDSLLSMPFYKLWKTQEMLELFTWINQYNRSQDHKVKFIGFDMEDLGLRNSRRMLREFGEKYNPGIRQQTLVIDGDLDSLIKLSRVSMDSEQTIRAAMRIKNDLLQMDSLINMEKNRIDQQTVFELKSYVRVCRQWIENRFFKGNRDEFMAENINIFLDSHPKEKVFLWAHNFHVANVNLNGQKTMGAFLKEKYEGQYFSLSITSGGGKYMASSNYSQKNWKSYEMEHPYRGTYEYIFSKIKPDNYFLKFSGENKKAARLLFGVPMKQLDIGYIYTGEDHYQYHGVLTSSFDGVVFIRHSTASHSLIF
ncbi:erythromycin esterase family protein [Pedobacter sp. MC2016-05]|uniref:erythromycin esterase family protein n=1 Tax=Pedobacter sp. MC2016-05 TaxID=2994474 RepID=UPI0022460B07|nr:erythromycin esterase family protein [Pedobacter sp. MC2016-05]MCX2476507.1 erythromycin esterase family protein [Pedobacter sp. MC2016-05]